MDTGDARQSGFSAAVFRDAISFAMAMGLPQEESERVTFRWISQKTWERPDSRGSNYDFTDSPTATVSADDQVASLTLPCAVEFSARRTSSADTPMVDFDISAVTLTMLDVDYQQLLDANLGMPDLVVIDGNTYEMNFWAPPMGMFDVTVYQAYAQARDES